MHPVDDRGVVGEVVAEGVRPEDDRGPTAQQRGENLQKVAVAVAVVSGSDLINSGIRGIDQLGTLVPAIQIPNSSQGNFIFVRGVGNFSFTPNSDPAAAYNFDGVYVGRASSTLGSFYDLERVEVLKGPQGTLYGRNATAGALNVLPVQPRLGETSGYVTGTYGNYDAITAEGALNLGLGDNAALRVSANYGNHEGYLRDGTQDEDQFGVRAQLKVDLTPDLTVRVAGDYSEQRGSASSSSYSSKFAFSPATGFTVTPSGLPEDEGLFTARAQTYRTTNGAAGNLVGRFSDPLLFRPFQRNNVYGISVHVDYSTPIGTVSVIPAWRIGYKNNLSTDAAQQIGTTSEAEQYSIEARLVSDGGGLIDYNLGVFYFSEQINDDLYNSGGTQAGFIKSRYKTQSPAAYGRVTLNATDWLRFTGGLRYTEDRKDFTSLSQTLALVCAVPAACPTAPLLPFTRTLAQQPFLPATSGATIVRAPGILIARGDVASTGELRQDKITYRGAIEVDLGPRSLLYGSIETGYRAGGFNAAFNFGPETLTAYTIGSKNRFLDDRLQLNLEGFIWKYRGQQINFLGVDPLGRIGVLTQNVGTSDIKGFEVEARARVTRGTTLSANVQYLDATYDSFSFNTPARPFTGCAVTQTTTFNVNCVGRPAVNSPKWTLNFGGEQIIPLGEYQVVLSADTQYRSSRFVGFGYTAEEFVRSNWASNAHLSFGTTDGRYVIGAFVRNIEDNRVITSAQTVPASNLIVKLRSAPRTYGVRLSTRF